MVRSLSRRNLAAAATLSVIAGYVDGFGFVFLGGYFVSFMSGNTTRASVDLAGSAWGAALFAATLILSFVVGAATGTAFAGGRIRGETWVLLLVTSMIAIAALAAMVEWRLASGMALALAMGALNTVFARGGEVSFGITYMTGALVKLAQSLVVALRGGERWAWVRYLVMWSAIAAGAVLGAAAWVALGAAALWVVVVGLATLLAVRPLRVWAHH